MSTPPASDVVVRVAGLSKVFGHTRALDGAGLTLRRGAVHALLGGNGSGKSTAIKILAGVYTADAGTIAVHGIEHAAAEWTSVASREAGFRFVHQDLGLFDELSIAENFALDAGYPTSGVRRVRWKKLRSDVAALLEAFEIQAVPDQPVGALRPAQRSMVAIARALQETGASEPVLVLDEPTATLPAHESEALLQAIRRRANLGQTVVMVSHRMAEVLEVADDFTVFRDGRSVASLVGETPSEDDLVAHMVGRPAGAALPGVAERARQEAAPALEITSLHAGPLAGVDLQVLPGEIVGVTGLVGSGRSTLLRTVFGTRRPDAGDLLIHGVRQSGREDAKTRMAAGVAYVAEDRLAESSFLDLSIRENLGVSVLREFWGARGMSRAAESSTARDLVRTHRVKAGDLSAPFATLSGGNQQKVVLARWLRREPRILLLDEPTQGVDVMSRQEIYQTVRSAASAGTAVLVASSDFAELAALCDRVVILQRGVVAGELSGDDLTADQLTAVTQTDLLRAGAPR
ncbi:sugar ABC transporter ATP-binding protein [Flexivirga oryzae]|uniref:Ribose transport system ATP-binding protein n=1 Tax=Flexivirga oryzae TaxID=1794944 RepID=A0A839NAY3_9MICO|nr:sugar ABC transporter ATP-binding protein [Flexivirga oryzae]MBB2891881.1 ribose transport system ATP-binding protein [Flexivirga oryzae]